MDTVINYTELIDGLFYGFMFAALYFAPSLFRKLAGNSAAEGTVYVNENGSTCYRRRNYKF